MELPTVIDDNFFFSRERDAWIHVDTGIAITRQTVQDMNIPITNTRYQEAQRKANKARFSPAQTFIEWLEMAAADDAANAARKDDETGEG